MSLSSLKIMKKSPITEYSDLDVATDVSYNVASSSSWSMIVIVIVLKRISRELEAWIDVDKLV